MGEKSFLERNWPILVLLFVVVGWMLFSWMNHYVVEDSYISFRYARNLVRGEGLVFNPGERAEGYSNLLWVLLITAGGALGAGYEGIAVTLGLVSGALVLILCWLLLRRLCPEKRVIPLAGTALAVLYFPLSFWSGSGLETPLFCALLFGSAYAYLRDSPSRFPWTGLWLGLLALTRAEGFAYILVFLIHYFWMRRRGIPTGVGWRDLVVALALPIAQLVFRLCYYGLWLPLPAYVKAGGTLLHAKGGIEYIFSWAWGSPVILIGILALYGVIRRWRKPGVTLFVMLAAAVFAFVLYSGGDLMGHFRFLLPVYVFTVVLGVFGLTELVAEMKPLFPSLLAGCLVLWCTVAFTYTAANQFRHPREFNTVASTTWLRDNVPPGTYVASGAMGRLGYFSELPLIDYYGLCNVETALHGQRSEGLRPGHDVGNAEVVFREEPGLIVIRPLPAPYRQIEEWIAGVRATSDYTWDQLTFAQQLVLSHPKLDMLYQPMVVDVTAWLPEGSPETEPLFLGFYARRGELEKLLNDRGARRVSLERPAGMR